MKAFPFFQQLDAMTCGPTCLKMVCAYYGKNYSITTLRERSYISKVGVNLLGISEAAESVGFRSTGVLISFDQLCNQLVLPAIVHWQQNHFVVVYDIRKRRKNQCLIRVADPAKGLIEYTETEFCKNWYSTIRNDVPMGTALMLQPGTSFYSVEDEPKPRKNLRYFFSYLTPYKRQLMQVFIGMLVASLLQLIFPFLTQSLVDVGVRDSNLNFIQLVLIAQLVLFVAKVSVESIRSWLLLHINARINISILSEFLLKLMKMPLGFFDTRLIGDILQRISDHKRIEQFLTGSSIATLFSFVNFFVFALVLGYYNWFILSLFLVGNVLYLAWVMIFLKRRRMLDFKRFDQVSKEQGAIIQMITGMQDIKLNNCERQKRWDWERIQVKLFSINVKSLNLGQMQQLGSVFLNQTTNILITFLAAKSVVDGSMTLGMMLAITYILGQLNAPIEQFIGFAQSLQDAGISMDRLNEIHTKDDEDINWQQRVDVLPENKSIHLNNLDFSYDGTTRNLVLNDVNLTIPQNQITAIVGASGSGKTTLLKLMLGFYPPIRGEVRVDTQVLQQLNPHVWRSKIGSVLQDGYLFSDSIARNIAMGEDEPDMDRLIQSVELANIRGFIDQLPLGFNTQIGMEGMGLSQGQKQRLLIARAVYKNPDYLFFDEATNALDANNEYEIMAKLSRFYTGRTVVVVAHRLSTVKNADQIVVLDQGKIAEVGTHESLTQKQGLYYHLVKNQLELGN